jgi:hypothetical protein
MWYWILEKKYWRENKKFITLSEITAIAAKLKKRLLQIIIVSSRRNKITKLANIYLAKNITYFDSKKIENGKRCYKMHRRACGTTTKELWTLLGCRC